MESDVEDGERVRLMMLQLIHNLAGHTAASREDDDVESSPSIGRCARCERFVRALFSGELSIHVISA
jgi:hypothetical protein